MFKSIDHLGVATRDIAKSIETLRKIGPIRLGKEEVIEAFGVRAVMVAAGEGTPIELIEPTTDESNVAKYIERRGEGLHHVAYRVGDIDAALAHCEKEGFRLIDEKPRHGYAESRVAFIHPKGMLGVLTELVEREPGRDEAPYDPE